MTSCVRGDSLHVPTWVWLWLAGRDRLNILNFSAQSIVTPLFPLITSTVQLCTHSTGTPSGFVQVALSQVEYISRITASNHKQGISDYNFGMSCTWKPPFKTEQTLLWIMQNDTAVILHENRHFFSSLLIQTLCSWLKYSQHFSVAAVTCWYFSRKPTPQLPTTTCLTTRGYLQCSACIAKI